MAKRLTLMAYDALSVIVLACLLSCAVVVPAYAYIDPSVMTYTIQAVAGVAVALSTLAGVALRRGRKTLMRVLDIDENARREIEADVHRTGPDGAILREDVNAKVLQPAFDRITAETEDQEGQEAYSGGKAAKKGRHAKRRPASYAPSWKERLVHLLRGAPRDCRRGCLRAHLLDR